MFGPANEIGGKEDESFLQIDGGLLDKQSKAFEKRFDAIEKRMATKDDIRALNQSIERGFADQKAVIGNAFPSREEFEELRTEEVDELQEKRDSPYTVLLFII